MSLTKLCRWFEVRRRTVYYQPAQSAPKLQDRFVKPIKAMIEEHPSFGDRTVAHLPGMNNQRPHQALGMRTLAEVYALAA